MGPFLIRQRQSRFPATARSSIPIIPSQSGTVPVVCSCFLAARMEPARSGQAPRSGIPGTPYLIIDKAHTKRDNRGNEYGVPGITWCPRNYLSPGGFVAAGQTVREEGDPDESSSERSQRKTGNALMIHHYDVYYNNKQIRTGFGGPVDSNVVTDLSDTKKYQLKRIDYGSLTWGSHPGMPCKCATAAMIVSCIKKCPTPRREEYSGIGGNNCQTDVEFSTNGCCLVGFTASGPGPDSSNYMAK